MEPKNWIIFGLAGGLVVGVGVGFLIKWNMILLSAAGMGVGFLVAERKIRDEV